jgi:hypothetical protein
VLDGLALEPGRRRRRQAGETAGHFRALGSLAHHVGAPAAAGQDHEGVHDDGFSGSGLARERGEAGAEIERCLIDDHEIPQVEMRQHGRAYSPFP